MQMTSTVTVAAIRTELADIVMRAAELAERTHKLHHMLMEAGEPLVVTDPTELYVRIHTLLTAAPRKFAELRALTQAPDNAIKGALIKLQRDNEHVVNLGNKYRAIWAIVSPELLAKLRAKK